MQRSKLRYLLAASIVSCMDVDAPIGNIPSSGKVIVPLTAEEGTGFRLVSGIVELNKKFNLEAVERKIFELDMDLPSKGRLLTEFKCFRDWRSQHDFYAKVVKNNPCAWMRLHAVELLEQDACNSTTVDALLEEYKKTAFPQIQAAILKVFAISTDARAQAAIADALKSKSKLLSRAARDAKALGKGVVCAARKPDEKTAYGLTEVYEACEGIAPTPAPQAEESEEADKAAAPTQTGVFEVKFK